jgi:hypothetical protein
MRKIVMFENVSNDGYFAGPNGEIDGFVASKHTGNQAEFNEESAYAIDSLKFMDTLLFGRVTYELMASILANPECDEEGAFRR